MYHVELTQDGAVYSADIDGKVGASKLTSAEGGWRGDVFIAAREMAIGNGAFSKSPEHNNPIHTLTGRLVVTTHEGVIVDTVVEVRDAQMYHIQLSEVPAPRIDQRDMWYFDWHPSNGSDEPDFPEWLYNRIFSWGPNPDIKDPGQTGSPRMVSGRCGPVHVLLDAEANHRPVLDDAARWIRDQGKRQVWYYDWSEVNADMPGFPQLFRAKYHPKARVGKGYRAPGGFQPTYSGTEHFGRITDGEWWIDKSIPYPMDHMHFEVHKSAVIAMATKSIFALWYCVAECEANHSRMIPGGPYTSSRSFGWVAEGYIITQRLCSVYWPDAAQRLEGYIDTLLGHMEAANVHHIESGIMLPCNGPYSKSNTGHMEPTDATKGALQLMGGTLTTHRVRGLDNILAHNEWVDANPGKVDSPYVEPWIISINDDSYGELARGVCVWQEGIRVCGLDKIMEWGTIDQRKRARRQMDISAALLSRAAQPELWLDQSTLEPASQLTTYQVLHDVSGLGLARSATKTPAGTPRSFLIPGVEVIIRRYQLENQLDNPLVTQVASIIAAMGTYFGSSGDPDKGLGRFRAQAGWESHGRGAV